jgi:hypothetical protein
MKTDVLIKIPETRGAKRKYDYDIGVGETRSYPGAKVQSLISNSRTWCNRRGLDWRYKCYTINGVVNIVRIK